jgi:hypothetical protein
VNLGSNKCTAECFQSTEMCKTSYIDTNFSSYVFGENLFITVVLLHPGVQLNHSCTRNNAQCLKTLCCKLCVSQVNVFSTNSPVTGLLVVVVTRSLCHFCHALCLECSCFKLLFDFVDRTCFMTHNTCRLMATNLHRYHKFRQEGSQRSDWIFFFCIRSDPKLFIDRHWF